MLWTKSALCGRIDDMQLHTFLHKIAFAEGDCCHGAVDGLSPIHRRGTELFQVAVRLLRLLDEHPATHQSAGDARNQGVEQLAQHGRERRRCAVDVGFGVSAQHRTTFFFSRAQLPSLRCGPSCGKFGH